MMKRTPTIIVMVLLIAIFALYMCAYQVRFTERAVVTRFERVVEGREVKTGLNFKLPAPIERVHVFDARLRSFETPITELSTADQKTPTVSSFATWRIADAAQFLKAIGSEEAASVKIGDLLKDAVSKVLKRHEMSELINTDPQKIRFKEIEKEMLDAVASQSKTRYGVEVQSVGIRLLGLPEKSVTAVIDRMKEERKAVSTKLLADGRSEADRITANANAVANKIRGRAGQYAKSIAGQGEAIAAEQYKVFQENPVLASLLQRLDALKNVMTSGETTLIIDARYSDPFQQLMQAAPQDASEGADEPQGVETKG